MTGMYDVSVKIYTSLENASSQLFHFWKRELPPAKHIIKGVCVSFTVSYIGMQLFLGSGAFAAGKVAATATLIRDLLQPFFSVTESVCSTPRTRYLQHFFGGGVAITIAKILHYTTRYSYRWEFFVNATTLFATGYFLDLRIRNSANLKPSYPIFFINGFPFMWA